jgi:hypothetical protein
METAFLLEPDGAHSALLNVRETEKSVGGQVERVTISTFVLNEPVVSTFPVDVSWVDYTTSPAHESITVTVKYGV